MSTVIVNEIRRGFYLDSVALMRLSGEIAGLPGVEEAALMMGSSANQAILRDSGMLESGAIDAGANDLVIAIRAHGQTAARDALAQALKGLEQPRAAAGEARSWRPRSIRAAVDLMPSANLALIAVPGEFAAAEARKAMRRGLNVMMFSDNVSLEEELALKREAVGLGLLMMGPDCGTAIINGMPLAFANSVRRGNVGIIGASGTGTQEVASLVSQGGGGVSHAIGVGGRDLNGQIGGLMTQTAIEALDEDAATERVVLISKPPAPAVAARILERIGRSPKPYTVCFIGAGGLEVPPNATQATTLRDAAAAVLGGQRIGGDYDVDAVAAQHVPDLPRRGRIEGLFAGGTLCAEAQLVLLLGGRRVGSNAPVPGAATIEADTRYDGDRVLDFGADELTRARPHPMIDPAVRDDAVRRALADPEVGAILVDVVIGHGAHADPAGRLAALAGGHTAAVPIIASITGTELDPQVRSRQERALREAGIVVAPSNAHACEVALAAVAARERG